MDEGRKIRSDTYQIPFLIVVEVAEEDVRIVDDELDEILLIRPGADLKRGRALLKWSLLGRTHWTSPLSPLQYAGATVPNVINKHLRDLFKRGSKPLGTRLLTQNKISDFIKPLSQ